MLPVTIDAFNHRVMCECCACPSRQVLVDRHHVPDFANAQLSCPLCDWENAPLDESGDPAPASAEDGAARNGGHTLAESQANFGRFLSMYDPSQREPWMPSPPAAEEMHWKQQLVERYRQFLDPSQPRTRTAIHEILSLEHAIGRAARARIKAAQADAARRARSGDEGV